MGSDKPNRAYVTKRVRQIELLSWLFLVVSGVLTAISISSMPDVVPTHFDLAGNPDGWGSPASLLLYPAILAFSFACISGCLHLVDPKYWNTPSKVTEEDKPRWLHESARVVVLTELILALHALVLQHCLINGLEMLNVPSVVVLLVALAILYGVMFGKLKKEY